MREPKQDAEGSAGAAGSNLPGQASFLPRPQEAASTAVSRTSFSAAKYAVPRETVNANFHQWPPANRAPRWQTVRLFAPHGHARPTRRLGPPRGTARGTARKPPQTQIGSGADQADDNCPHPPPDTGDVGGGGNPWRFISLRPPPSPCHSFFPPVACPLQLGRRTIGQIPAHGR